MTKSNGFIKLDRDLIATDAWQALTAGEIALLIHLWSKHNGKNNGALRCGVREIEHRFGCSSKTAVSLLRGLQDKGFVARTARGAFNQKTGSGRASRWRLTTEPWNGSDPTREFLSWTP
jgi:DNA-binding MarR family transcriptional regulator